MQATHVLVVLDEDGFYVITISDDEGNTAWLRMSGPLVGQMFEQIASISG